VSGVAAAEARAFLLERFSEPLLAIGLTPAAAPEDLDLLGQGVTDSLGILEMISDLEEQFGVEIDFEDLDPEDLTSLGPFCRFVEMSTGGAAA
jgi:acyl carrier protein